MKQCLKIVSAGVEIGEVKGKDLIPDHALAMCSSLLCREAFATEEISYKARLLSIVYEKSHYLPVTALVDMFKTLRTSIFLSDLLKNINQSCQ